MILSFCRQCPSLIILSMYYDIMPYNMGKCDQNLDGFDYQPNITPRKINSFFKVYEELTIGSKLFKLFSSFDMCICPLLVYFLQMDCTPKVVSTF